MGPATQLQDQVIGHWLPIFNLTWPWLSNVQLN